MAAMTNLLVKDDAATVTEFTFVPVTDTPNPLWRTQVAGVPIEGQHRITASWEPYKNGGYKLTVKLELSVMETLGASGTSAGYVAPPKVAYVIPCIFTMFADKRSTSQDRANALKMIVGVLQGASSTTATGILDQASVAQSFANSTLPGPKIFTQIEIPN